MSSIITLGAINKNTGEYVCPKMANKKDEHICIDCKKDLILCKGEIRVYHFRHHTETIKCNYYNSPNETQIHKDAKMLMKMMLDKKIPISFIRNCSCCNKNDVFEIPEITETSSVKIEYRFDYNGLKIADVAYIDNGELICIFEICNTHKTKCENRPEPWFEIDAETLLTIANDICVKIPCIRYKKCEECIEKEKIYIENKSKAVNILYDWLKDGNELYPFIIKCTEFGKIQKYIKSEYTALQNELYDLIIYEKREDSYYESYYIQLVYEHKHTIFTKEDKEIAENRGGIYYIDINWVLSQIIIPNQIQYIAGVDSYVKDCDSIYCNNCDASIPFYVKRITPYMDYKVINMGCLSCNHNSNTEFANCFRCKENTDICIMETNIHKLICKNCDIYLFNKILLYVPFDEKDQVKMLGGRFDKLCKKWYIEHDNKKMEIILSKWKKTEPDQSNTKHPY